MKELELKGAVVAMLGHSFTEDGTALALGLIMPDGERRILLVPDGWDLFNPDDAECKVYEAIVDSRNVH